MKLPYSWLQELLPGLPGARDLEPILANLGLPVEEIVPVPAPPAGVVYAQVLDVTPIEGTQLFSLTVEAGEPAPVTVVTGAPNATANVGVALAKPGTVIDGAEVDVRAVQGVASWGMACSPKELRVGEYAGGLLLLPLNTAKPGTPLVELWQPDDVIDIEVTPNRADALSALGVARDLAAALKLDLREPSRGAQPQGGAAQPIPVTLTDGCDRFVARTATDVRNGPSPLFMQRRLLAAGLRPIDLIVDASNYVMLELGQPTALYDARDVAGGISVDGAREGETVVTLGDEEKTLTAGDLVIRDGQGRVIGVAGVTGAQHGEVRADTSSVVLESAHFDPVRLRLTARRLGLATDAVYRFERGVDPNISAWAADRIMEILARYGDADVQPGVTDAGGAKQAVPIAFRPQSARDLLGMDISDDEMRASLTRLGCVVSDDWQVTPPTWRVDMNIPQDLTEEVVRLHGYAELPETIANVRVHESNVGVGAEAAETRAVKGALAGLGFQEVVTYTFTNDDEAARARAETPHLRLRNPLTSEGTAMRTALYPSLLRAAQVNAQSTAQTGAPGRVRLFEIGHAFPATGEVERLAVLARGPLAPGAWQPALHADFYTFKGQVEALAAALGAHLEVRQLTGAEVPGALHPGIAGEVVWNAQPIGWIGALHPAVTAAYGLKGDTYLMEVGFPLPGRPWAFRDIRRAPAALRDLAVIMPQDVTYAQLQGVLRAEGGDLLERVEPFDVYTGAQIPAHHRSVAMHLTFRGERTLQDADVDPVFTRMMNAVRTQGWTIRER